MNRRLRWLLLLVLLALFTAGCYLREPAVPPGPPGEFLFCFWNVENLFDDHDDGRPGRADREYDRWFARDPEALQLKLDHLSRVLLGLNEGRGPDILALAEVEDVRAAELLQEALNRRVPDPSLQYTHLLMKEVVSGRHIAPAILSRLPVRGDRTRLLGSHLRILEGHIVVNQHDLIVVASHWTSNVSDDRGAHRDKYADQIYGAYRGMFQSNPRVDLLVCGDFNAGPGSTSVTEHLHATGDPEAVLREEREPLLLDLFADKSAASYGTHFYHGKWYIYDHIVAAPGLLDAAGWSVDPASAETVATFRNPTDRRGRPWRFGNEHDRGPRGYSDHFPVTARLRVQSDAN